MQIVEVDRDTSEIMGNKIKLNRIKKSSEMGEKETFKAAFKNKS